MALVLVILSSWKSCEPSWPNSEVAAGPAISLKPACGLGLDIVLTVLEVASGPGVGLDPHRQGPRQGGREQGPFRERDGRQGPRQGARQDPHQDHRTYAQITGTIAKDLAEEGKNKDHAGTKTIARDHTEVLTKTHTGNLTKDLAGDGENKDLAKDGKNKDHAGTETIARDLTEVLAKTHTGNLTKNLTGKHVTENKAVTNGDDKVETGKGATMKLSKSTNGEPEVRWFGKIFLGAGVLADPDKILHIDQADKPKTIEDVRSRSRLQAAPYNTKYGSEHKEDQPYKEVTGPPRQAAHQGRRLQVGRGERRQLPKPCRGARQDPHWEAHQEPHRETRHQERGHEQRR